MQVPWPRPARPDCVGHTCGSQGRPWGCTGPAVHSASLDQQKPLGNKCRISGAPYVCGVTTCLLPDL